MRVEGGGKKSVERRERDRKGGRKRERKRW